MVDTKVMTLGSSNIEMVKERSILTLWMGRRVK